MQGATAANKEKCAENHISTHAPHARRDYIAYREEKTDEHFYSRASCKARRNLAHAAGMHRNFYSRASCKARRFTKYKFLAAIDISTHAPHARRDNVGALIPFYFDISTHAPHARRDTIYLHRSM